MYFLIISMNLNLFHKINTDKMTSIGKKTTTYDVLTIHCAPSLIVTKSTLLFFIKTTFSCYFPGSKSGQFSTQPPKGISLPKRHRSLSMYSLPLSVTVGTRYCSRYLHLIIPLHSPCYGFVNKYSFKKIPPFSKKIKL